MKRKPPSAQTLREMAAGRRAVGAAALSDAMNGIEESLRNRTGLGRNIKFDYAYNDDMSKADVVVRYYGKTWKDTIEWREPLDNFPSDELVTNLVLIGGGRV